MTPEERLAQMTQEKRIAARRVIEKLRDLQGYVERSLPLIEAGHADDVGAVFAATGGEIDKLLAILHMCARCEP